MTAVGIVYSYDEDRRLMGLKGRRRLTYYYMEGYLFKQFQKYLGEGVFVLFEAEEEAKKRRGVKAYTVHHFIKILGLRYRKPKVFYDASVINQQIVSTIASHKTKLFLDLELSMQPFEKGKVFTQEIIQAGMILEVHGTVIQEFNRYIKPQTTNQLTDRTRQFLGVSDDVLADAMPAAKFYEELKTILQTYRPQIYVWGRNDFLSLDVFYRLLKRPSLTKRHQFVDVMKLIKTYRNQKNDIGLLMCAMEYGYVVDMQRHDAFEDALMTMYITRQFLLQIKTPPK
jgi:sporulation inhibitor KapD